MIPNIAIILTIHLQYHIHDNNNFAPYQRLLCHKFHCMPNYERQLDPLLYQNVKKTATKISWAWNGFGILLLCPVNSWLEVSKLEWYKGENTHYIQTSTSWYWTVKQYGKIFFSWKSLKGIFWNQSVWLLESSTNRLVTCFQYECLANTIVPFHIRSTLV